MFSSRSLAAAAVLAASALFLVAAPASAHDELVGSDPEYGAALAAAPAEITLWFSADVLEVGAEVIVVDQSEKDWIAGAPAVAGDTVTVALAEGMPVAGYEMRWRVVSSDGHPISGIIPFTIGDAEPYARDQAVATSPQETQTTQEDQPLLSIALIGGAIAFLALAIVIVNLLVRRTKNNPGV